jgi:hypothetical protein
MKWTHIFSAYAATASRTLYAKRYQITISRKYNGNSYYTIAYLANFFRTTEYFNKIQNKCNSKDLPYIYVIIPMSRSFEDSLRSNRQFQLLVYACRGRWEVRYHIGDYAEKIKMEAYTCKY